MHIDLYKDYLHCLMILYIFRFKEWLKIGKMDFNYIRRETVNSHAMAARNGDLEALKVDCIFFFVPTYFVD